MRHLAAGVLARLRAARDTSEGARIRRVFYLLYEVQKYIFIEHFRKGDVASARGYKRESMRLARALTSSKESRR